MSSGAPRPAPTYFVDDPENISLIAQVIADKVLLAGETKSAIAEGLGDWCRRISPTGVATTEAAIRVLLSDTLEINEWGEHASYTADPNTFQDKSSYPVERLCIEKKPAWLRFLDRRKADGSMEAENVVRSLARDFDFVTVGLPVDCYAVLQEGEITGAATVNAFTRDCDEISALYVEPQHRRKGVASSLLAAASKETFARGKLPAYFAGGNPPSLQRLLAGLGFSQNSYFWEWRFWW